MGKRLFGTVLLGLCLFILTLGCVSVRAQGINRQVSYQGKLLDSTGVAVVDGAYQMKFSLYSAASGGVTLWAASGTTAVPTAIPVTIQGGLFSLMLGDPSASGGWQNTLDGIDWNSSSIYLGVTIAADAEMSPRKRLGAVPQAFNAEQLQGMYASSSASGGQSLFVVHQTENNAATGTRSALEVRTDGTSAANDLLFRGVDGGPNITTFSINRLGSVTSTGQFAFLGSGTSTVSGSVSVGGNVSSTYLYAANATLATLVATTLNTSGLVWTNATGTNTTSTNLYASLFGFGNANGTNVTSTNSYATFLQFANALGTNVTSTSLAVTGTATSTFGGDIGVVGTVSSTDAVVSRNALVYGNFAVNGNVTLGDVGSDFVTVNGSINSSLLPTADGVPLLGTPSKRWLSGAFVNVTSTNATSTYLYAESAVLRALTATTLNASGLVWTNATGTNTTSTNLYATLFGFDTASGTSVSSTNAYAAFLQFVNALGTNVTTTNSYASFAQFGNALGTNVTSTSLAVTGTATSTFGGSVSVMGNVSTTRAIVDNRLTVNGVSTFDGLMTANGSAVFNGEVTLGDAPTDVITVDGRFAKDLVPIINNISDVGTSDLRWRTGYFVNVTSTNTTSTYLYAESAVLRALTATTLNASGLVWTNATGTNTTSTNLYATLFGFGTANGTSVTTTNSYATFLQFANALGTNVTSTSLAVTGTATSTFGGDINVAGTVSSTDAVVSRNALVHGTSTVLGNLYVGTSTVDVAMHGSFTMSGDDLFVQGNIGSATSVYTNGAFIAGTGSTYYGNSYLMNTVGSYVASSTQGFSIIANNNVSLRAGLGINLVPGNGFVLGNSDGATSLGSSSNRFNAEFWNTTTTNATSTNAYATLFGFDTANGTSVTTTNSYASFAQFGNALGTNVTSTSLAVTGTATSTFGGSISVADRVSSTHATVDSSFTVNGTSAFDGTMTVNGSAVFNGAVTLGDASADSITVNGVFVGSLVPANNSVYDLGTNTSRWRTGYFVNVSSTNATSTYSRVLGGLSADTIHGSSITSLGSVAAGASPRDVVVDDRFVYVMNTSTSQVRLFNAASSTPPGLASTISYTPAPTAMAVRDGTIYTVHADGTFHVHPVAETESSVSLGSGTPTDLVISGRYAYVTVRGAPNLLVTIDIADSSAPVVVANVFGASLDDPAALFVQDKFLYVVNESSDRFSVFFLGNPALPSALTNITLSGGFGPKNLVVQGDYAYVLGASALQPILVSDPSAPVLGATTIAITGPRSLMVVGREVFVTDSAGVSIIQAANPDSITLSTSIPIASSNPIGLAVRGRKLYVTDAEPNNTLRVYQLPGVEATGGYFSSAEVGQLQVLSDGRIGQNLDVGGSLQVGQGGLASIGSMVINAPNTTSSITGNLTVGTSTVSVTMHAGFVMSGDDLFVGGNIGSASSVYTNGAFIAGTGSTYYNAASLVNTTGDFTVTSTGNLVLNANGQLSISAPAGIIPTIDGTNFGNASNRFNGEFINTTTTNATTTNLYTNSLEFQSASGTSATTTNLFARHIVTDDAQALVRTDSQIPLVATVAITTGAASTVLTDDRFAVVLHKIAGQFTLFDLASSTRPFELGAIDTGVANISDGFLQGHLLFLTFSESALMRIYDLSDGLVTLRGTLNTVTLGKPRSVSVQGAYAYIIFNGTNRFAIADISNLDKPYIVSSITTSDTAPTRITVKGRYAYVTHAGTGTTYGYDVMDPYHPYEAIIVPSTTGSADIIAQGSYLYVGGTTGVNVIDALVGPSNLPYSGITDVLHLALAGRYLLATTSTGWSIVDVLDPSSPQLVQSIYVEASAPGGIAVRGRYVFVTDTTTNNLLVYQLPGIEAAGIEVGAANIGMLQVLGDGKISHSLDVGDGLVVGYGGIRSQGGFAVSATNTTSTILGNFMVGTSSRDVALHSGFVMDGDDMFVGGNIGSASSVYTNGSFIAGTGSTYYNAGSIVNTTGNYTVTSTSNLVLNANGQLNIAAPLGILPTIDATTFGGSSNRFDAYLRYATTTGLEVKDRIKQTISSETNWAVKSTFAGMNVAGIQVVGDYSYAIKSTGLTITNIHNPASPVQVGTLTVGSGNQDIAILGDYAYITAHDTPAIYVIDISDPSAPFLANTVTEVFAPISIEIQGRYAYVTDDANGGLAIFDLGHATGPRLMSRVAIGSTNDVAVMGKYAYVTEAVGQRLYTLNISDPANVPTGSYISYADAFQPNTIVGQGGYLYVSDAVSASVQILSATTTPHVISTKPVGGKPALPDGLAAQGNYLYVVGASYGYLQAFDISTPLSGALPLAKELSLGTGSASEGAVQVIGRYAYVGSEATDAYVSIVDLGGIQAANMRAESFQAGDLSVLGDGRIDGNLSLQGGVSVAQGIMALGSSVFAASSTGASAQFVNRADHEVNTGSWGAYIDRLLVGNNLSATGTEGYSQIINYIDDGKHYGLCIKRSSIGGCPDAATYSPDSSIITDEAVSANAFDLAETYASVGDVTSTDLLIFGSTSTTTMRSSGVPYDPRIMGVASTRPGFVLGVMSGVQVALVGRVPVKISTVNGAIAIGDPLTTSEYPGVAMKATKPGMILGYALEPATATSTIEVFIKTGYSAGTILNTDGTVARLSDDLVVDSRTVATEHAPTVDSWGLTFRGSAWNDGVVTQPSFSLITNVVTATSSAFVIRNASSTSVFAIDQLGTATIAGDLMVGGRLYPSGRGAAQNSKYIFLDDTSTSTQYMATNADGWQANDSYDFAERYYSPDALDTGDLVIASDRGQFHVQRSLNETGLLMGIVSTRPAFVAGKQGADMYPVALAGRVPTKVSNMNGAIKVGDALAPSTIPGTAVKATKAGPIVGLALENYDAATVGKIEVFVNPGWWGGAEGGATGNTQHVSTEGTPTNGTAPATVNADGSAAYRGFASIAAGSKRVHVAYDSVLSYPNIQATPRGQVHGGWWTDNYTDIGFDVFMSEIQTRDVTFAWNVEGTPTGARIYLSDGTYALVNPTTGEAVVQTIATSTESGAPSIGNRVSGIENGESSAVVTTPATPVVPAPVETPSVPVPSSATTTVESLVVTTTTIDSSTGSVMSSSASEAEATQSDTSGSTSTSGL